MKELHLSQAQILVISPNENDSEYMQEFFKRIEAIPTPHFVVNKLVVADKYDFIIFDCRMFPVYKREEYPALPPDLRAYFNLLERYISNTTKYILFFGKFYHNLNQERCPSANSKFTLFARINELIDFINHYKSAE